MPIILVFLFIHCYNRLKYTVNRKVNFTIIFTVLSCRFYVFAIKVLKLPASKNVFNTPFRCGRFK